LKEGGRRVRDDRREKKSSERWGGRGRLTFGKGLERVPGRGGGERDDCLSALEFAKGKRAEGEDVASA
jgi:hypothetical protein